MSLYALARPMICRVSSILALLFCATLVQAQDAYRISTFAGPKQTDNLPATQTYLEQPQGLVWDAQGNLFIAEAAGARIRKVDTSGTISTDAGTGHVAYSVSGNNGPATAANFGLVRFITLDRQGNLYLSDQANHVVRKIDKSTGIITTVVGTGTPGYSGDGGLCTSAQLNTPRGLAFDANNNLYIVDQGNAHVRKVDGTTGIITTVPSITFNGPNGITIGPDNSVYLSTNDSYIYKLANGQTTKI